MTLKRRDIGSSLRRDVTTSRRWNIATSQGCHFVTSPRRNVGTSQRRECLTQTSCQVTSHYIMSHPSHHVMSRHTFWVWMNNVVTLGANVVTLLEIYEQRRNVGHERHDVARFFSDEKDTKTQYLGLLSTSKLFPLYINHPRSSHDHIHKEKHWILTFPYQKSHLRNF